MKFVKGWFSVASVVWIMAMLAGCSGDKLVQITGVIQVDGKPAEGAVLLFHPEGAGSVASGVADASGKYTLVSSMNPGVAPGQYRVTVTWPDPAKKPSDKEIMMGTSKDQPDLLKSRYISLDKSTLTAEVTKSTKELPPFELTSK